MNSQFDPAANRRRFLQFLGSSAAVSWSGSALAQALQPRQRLPDPMVWAPRDLEHLIASPKDAINVFDLDLMADSRVTIPIPERHCSGVVLLHGDAEIQGQPYPGEAHIAVLSRDGDAVTLHAKTNAKLLILSGEPINEPVASYGPFVMNTREEIMQAMDDYRAGRMGHLS